MRHRNTNPFRGGNVCHRLELPPRRRVRRRRDQGARARGARVVAPRAEAPRAEEARAEEARAEEARAAEARAAEARVEGARVEGAGHSREVELLERRLSKVKSLLARREDELQRLAARRVEDPGVASIYQEVQGLGEDGPQAERKREMMDRIFEANLELLQDLQTGSENGH